MSKVTDEELQELRNMRETLVEIVTSIGELHLNEFIARNQLEAIQQSVREQERRFVEFQEKERVLFGSLQEKYGTGNIDIDTGEISA
jgi:hypothetical protein